MRVKKWITLLLSGAILAGSLAGCSRTIIEHQFHTDTVTNTEIVTDIIEIPNTMFSSELEDFFAEHGVKLSTYSMYHYSELSFTEESFSDWSGGIEPDGSKVDIDAFLKNDPYDHSILLGQKYEGGFSECMTIWSEQAKNIYNTFVSYEEKNPNMWEQMTNVEGNPCLLGYQVYIYETCDEEENYYNLLGTYAILLMYFLEES